MQLAKPRYSQKAFPKYRYVPTVNPHPGIHPEGHSYGKPEEKLSYIPPEKWTGNGAYLYGVDLFNHGYWWEAHEAWENVWLTTKKSDLEGQFLQGLIQFSAALLKLYSGNKSGFDNLYQEAEKKIQFCLQELSKNHRRQFMGLNLTEWISRMETFRRSLPETLEENFEPLNLASFPVLLLESKLNHS
jgi:hypothetical protein